MNKSFIKIAFVVLLLAALVAACDNEPRSVQTETKTVAAGGAKAVEVELRMGAGQLRLTAAAQEALLEATFRYNRERLRPEVDYRVSGDTGVLRVGTRRHSGINFGRVRNDWDLRLGRALPVDLTLNLGAGESRLDLRGLDLSGVDVDMGVGEMTLDVSGPHARGFRVRINGGIGSATVYLPADVGVRASVHGGLGSIRARGLRKEGHLYTNDAFGKSPVTIDLEIDGGIGSIELRVEPGDRAKI
jgi:N-terminal domain of toast_rack, DUF2154